MAELYPSQSCKNFYQSKELGVVDFMVSSNPNDNRQNAPSILAQFSSQILSSPVIASVATGLIALLAPNAEAIAVSIGQGIPFDKARAAIEQEKMWQENFDCARTQQIKDFQTADNIKLSVTICPSGDMLVQVSETSQQANAKWISFESLHQNNELNTSDPNLLFSLFSSPAVAVSANIPSKIFQEKDNSQILAQATVICQESLGGGLIRRVVKYADGSCVIEEVNTFTGEVSRSSGSCQSC